MLSQCTQNLTFARLDSGFSTLENTGVLEDLATILLLPHWGRCECWVLSITRVPCDHRLFIRLL